MKSWFDYERFDRELGQFQPHEGNGAGQQEKEDVEAFLEGLSLLEGLPLSYLVPKADMLPPESLRLFWIDETWIRACQAGALSLGKNYETDRRRHRLLFGSKAKETDRQQESGGNRMGFLLRSSLVLGWPGMKPECVDGNGQPVKLLTLRKYGKDILLGIGEGEIARLIFREPQEALHYGTEASQNGGTVSLVSMKAGKEGEDLRLIQEARYRDPEKGVLQVEQLAGEIEKKLKGADALEGTLSPAMFAAELLYRTQVTALDTKKEERT